MKPMTNIISFYEISYLHKGLIKTIKIYDEIGAINFITKKQQVNGVDSVKVKYFIGSLFNCKILGDKLSKF